MPLLLLDLPPEPVLRLAPLLVEHGWYVVPVIQRWLASPAILPCRALLRLLVEGSWRARRPASVRGVVLVADGERLGPKGYPLVARGAAFDNRYEYQICRFPPPVFLQAHGVRQVRWLTSRTLAVAAQPSQAEQPVPGDQPRDLSGRPIGATAAPDLMPYQEGLLQAGIAVDVLAWPSES